MVTVTGGGGGRKRGGGGGGREGGGEEEKRKREGQGKEEEEEEGEREKKKRKKDVTEVESKSSIISRCKVIPNQMIRVLNNSKPKKLNEGCSRGTAGQHVQKRNAMFMRKSVQNFLTRRLLM